MSYHTILTSFHKVDGGTLSKNLQGEQSRSLGRAAEKRRMASVKPNLTFNALDVCTIMKTVNLIPLNELVGRECSQARKWSLQIENANMELYQGQCQTREHLFEAIADFVGSYTLQWTLKQCIE